MTSELYLIPTVISTDANDTIPDQVKEAIKEIDLFLVENIRTSRRYISSLKLGLTIEDLEFKLLDKKTSAMEVGQLLAPFMKGKKIGILSESGCPGVADPGSIAVSWAHKNNMRVIPLVGPSSLLLGLMASGFNGQRFCFHGYLPIDKKALEKEIRILETESKSRKQSQIFIETPYRNNQLLQSLLNTCKGETLICVAKNLSGETEVVKTMTINQWKSNKINLHKVPTVFLLYAGN